MDTHYNVQVVLLKMKEIMSGLNYLQPGCIFCEACHHKVLFSDEDFIVALDNFPLVEGHILIFSKIHYGCAGELPEQQLAKLTLLKSKVADLLVARYKKVAFYEHGRAGSCVSFGPDERLCHHFHLHALPIDLDISVDLRKRFPQHKPVDDYRSMDNLFQKFGEYLYFEGYEREGCFYPVADAIPSHLMRTLIADALHDPGLADWENFKYPVCLDRAYNTLRLQ